MRGPRYWPQALVSAGRDGSLDALYKTQTLFVQRKAGALPYAHDPSGGLRGHLRTACLHYSLLFLAAAGRVYLLCAWEVPCLTGRLPGGRACTCWLQYAAQRSTAALAFPAAPGSSRSLALPMLPAGVRSLLSHMFFRGGGAGEGGLDLVNLCATFGSDPFITSFAQVHRLILCLSVHARTWGFMRCVWGCACVRVWCVLVVVGTLLAHGTRASGLHSFMAGCAA